MTDYTKIWADIQQRLSVAARDLGVSQPFSQTLQARVDRIEKEQIVDGEELRNTLQAWKTIDIDLFGAIQSCHTDIQAVLAEVRGIKDMMPDVDSQPMKRAKLEDSSRGHDTMEVSGCGPCPRSEAKQGSDDVTNSLQCEQCHDSEWFDFASAFCSTCSDYLCADCVKRHRRIMGFKDHIILEGDKMPKEKSNYCDTDGEGCLEHPGKLIELYCHSHDTLVCVRCIATNHRRCTDVASISKLSIGLQHSREIRDAKSSSRKQIKIYDSCREIIDECRVINGDCFDRYVEKFKAFKRRIETSLDLLGKRVYREAGELKERNEKKLDSLSDSLKSLRQKQESLMSDIERKKTAKKNDQLFIALRMNAKNIVENRKKIYDMKKELNILTYTFVADPMIQQLLDSTVYTKIMKNLSGEVECTTEIDVKAPEDKRDCAITGLVEISPTDIVAVDVNNTSLKHIDVDKKIIITRRILSSCPWDVTMIPGSRVAVTLPYGFEIQYFDTLNQLALCSSIQVKGYCYGIQSTEDTLIVSFRDPGKVEMMDFRGNVMKSFIPTSRGASLFHCTQYLSLSPENTEIYVSDLSNGVVTCLSTSGRVNWKYMGKHLVTNEPEDRKYEGEKEEEEEEEEKSVEAVHEHEKGDEEGQESEDEDEDEDRVFYSFGLATGTDGCLYICSQWSNCIHVVSPAGTRLRVIPVNKYRIQYPKAVCYSKIHDSLYVSSTSDDRDYDNFIRRLSFQ